MLIWITILRSTNFFPFRGNGFYDADLVDYGVESGILLKMILLFNIKVVIH